MKSNLIIIIVIEIIHDAILIRRRNLKAIRGLYRNSLILVFTYSILTGCVDDYFNMDQYADITYSPDIAIPVGYASYTIDELIEKTDSLIEVTEGEGGLVILTFYDSLEKILIRDEVDIDDQFFDQMLDLDIDFPVTLPPGETVVIQEIEVDHDFDPGEEAEVDSIEFRNATMTINLETLMPADIIMTFKFYTMVKDGESLIVTIPMDYQAGIGINESIEIDISGYKMDLSAGGTDANSFNYKTSMEVTSVGAALQPQDHLDYEISFGGMEIEYLFGYIGNREIELEEQEFEFDFFNDFYDGLIVFANPEITLNINTNAGIVAALDFTQFQATDKKGDSLDLSGSSIDSPFIINGPDYDDSDQVITSTLKINNTNSNIVDFLAFQPVAMKLNGSLVANPDSEPRQKNFLTYNSEISGEFSFMLPLNILISELHISENLGVDNIDLSDFSKVAVKIRSENSIPFGGQVQVVFYDSNGMELFKLFDNHQTLMSAAAVDQNGFSIETELDSIFVELAKEEIRLIEQTDSINLDLILDTYNSQTSESVKIAFQNKLKVDLAILAGVDVKFNISGE